MLAPSTPSPRLQRAITRDVSRAIARCELTHLERTPIDVDLARRQHAAYEAALERLGCTLVRLPEEPELPDSVFVEDTALVLDEVAVILRPGAASRQPETASVARALAALRPLVHLDAGTVDGGDVLRLDRTIYVGLSSRSSEAGIDSLSELVAPHGYEVRGVSVRGCLHLKSAVTEIAERLLLFNPEWVDAGTFAGWEALPVAPLEPQAANALRLGEHLLCQARFPRTAAQLATRGLRLEPVDLSELAKAEGALTCCSLLVTARSSGAETLAPFERT